MASISPTRIQSSPFDVLNTDCLHHLYTFLSPLDMACASEAIDYLHDFASENIYHTKHLQSIYFSKFNRTLAKEQDELHLVLKHFGPYVTHFYLDPLNLTSLSLTYFRDIVRACPNLKEIYLINCSLSTNIKSHLNRSISTNLEFFDDECLSNFMKKLPNLRAISNQGYALVGKVRMEYLEPSHVFERIPDRYEALVEIMMSDDLEYKSVEVFQNPLNNAPDRTRINIVNSEPESSDSDDRHSFRLARIRYLQLINKPEVKKDGIFNDRLFKTLVEIALVRCDNNMLSSVTVVPSLRVLSIQKPHELDMDTLLGSVSCLPQLRHLYLTKFPKWTNEDTIRVLEHNYTIEKLTLKHSIDTSDSDSIPSVQKIIEFLAIQQELFERQKLHLEIVDDFDFHLSDEDEQLLLDNHHVLGLHFIRDSRKEFNLLGDDENEY